MRYYSGVSSSHAYTLAQLKDPATYEALNADMTQWAFDPARNSGLPMPVGFDVDYMDQSLLVLKVGETAALTPPFTAASWSTGEPNIAACDGGTVTAKRIGATCVSAYSADGRQSNCIVCVYQPVEQVSLSQSTAAMKLGTSLTLTTSLPDSDPQGILWSSSDPSVAEVSQDGTVSPKAAGTAVITAELPLSGGVSASCQVTVSAPVTAISLAGSASVNIGVPTALSCTVTPAAYTGTLAWASSDESILTVADGVVTGLKQGSAVVTVTSETGLSKTCTVTVKQPSTSLTLDRTEVTLELGYPDQLVATVLPADNTDSLSWSSSSSSIVSVSTTGLLTPKAAGKATVTVKTSSGLTAYCVVTVKAAAVLPQSVALDQTQLRPTVGEKVRLQATVLPTNADDRTVQWESSDPSVASVNAAGVVEAIAPGTAQITATAANGLYDRCTVKVSLASSACFVVDSARVKAGKTVKTTVHMTKNPGVSAFTLAVTYDPALLTPLSVSADALLAGGQLSCNAESGEEGVLYVTWYQTGEDATGDGPAFTVAWEAAQETGTAAVSLRYDEGDISNNEQELVAFTTEAGAVRVLDYQVGDIYTDDLVNMKDIVFFARSFNKLETLSAAQQLAADLYEDGDLDSRDLSMLASVLTSSMDSAGGLTLAEADTADLYYINVSSGSPDENGDVSIVVSGEECPGISAFRFQLHVPEGYVIGDIVPSDLLRSGTFTYDASSQIVTYYQTEDAILDGPLFTISLHTDEADRYGEVSLSYLPEDFFAAETYQEVPISVTNGAVKRAEYITIQDAELTGSTLSLTVDTNMADKIQVLTAYYDEKGQLRQSSVTQETVQDGTLRISTTKPADWSTCKVFLLDSYSCPLCGHAEIENT